MELHSLPAHNAVVDLLERSHLPTADVTDDLLEGFLGATQADQLVGCIGYERFDKHGLLRSLAVDPSARGSDLGTQLVAALEKRAMDDGVETLFLLTTDADRYFARLGYAVLPRDDTPEAIRGTRQFSSLCPDSAIVMSKSLTL